VSEAGRFGVRPAPDESDFLIIIRSPGSFCFFHVFGEISFPLREEPIPIWISSALPTLQVADNARFSGVALSWHEFLRMQEP
jgi:hypothetical protein